MSCDDCATAMNHPGLPTMRYNMGCDYCAARYMHNGGQDDITKRWAMYGVDPKRAHKLRAEGTLIDPELKRRKR